MHHYQLRLQLTAPGLTLWHSDTLFGVLAWQVLFERGESGLHEWLSLFKEGKPPFLLSNGFPGDLLPKPIIREMAPQPEMKNVADYKRAKARKKQAFVVPEGFAGICNGDIIDLQETKVGFKHRAVAHNTVSRLTGTTGEEGSLYEIEEFSLVGNDKDKFLSVYLAAETPAIAEEVKAIFVNLSHAGFGKKKSSGFGGFRVQDMLPWRLPKLNKSANGFVTLSNMVPAAEDPVKGFWRHAVKYGKLGESRAGGDSPFKLPFIYFEPGACFRTASPPRAWYGRLLEDLAPDMAPDVVQFTLGYAVPIAVPEEWWVTENHEC